MVSCKGKNSTVKKQSLTSETTKVEVPKEFTELLFAEQSLSEMDKMASANHINNDTTSVWSKFIIANKLKSENKKEDARRILQSIIETEDNEARTKVWAWNGLRELGFNSPTRTVLGVILEVPQQGSTEYLAMYLDKTARYVNYTGSIGVWETHEPQMDKLLADVIQLSQSNIMTEQLTKGRNKSLTEKVRFSFLTTSGIFQTEKTFEELSDKQNGISKVFWAATLVLQQFVDKMTNPNNGRK